MKEDRCISNRQWNDTFYASSTAPSTNALEQAQELLSQAISAVPVPKDGNYLPKQPSEPLKLAAFCIFRKLTGMVPGAIYELPKLRDKEANRQKFHRHKACFMQETGWLLQTSQPLLVTGLDRSLDFNLGSSQGEALLHLCFYEGRGENVLCKYMHSSFTLSFHRKRRVFDAYQAQFVQQHCSQLTKDKEESVHECIHLLSP